MREGAPPELLEQPILSAPAKRVVRTTPLIPDHQVIRMIGHGAYGEVWLAKSQTGAWRAVKVIWRQDFDDDRSFNREFEGILQYEPIARNYPGLVHILHVGRHDAGDQSFYYYVMELGDDAHTGIHINPDTYVPRTLRTDKKFTDGSPLPLDYCLEVASQLAHALLYLHGKDLTHRDIKPANVIFVNGRPKLADIGLVAPIDQRSFVGTEGFVPPEGPGTKRADVYALAKVLYEISTGKDRLDFPQLPDTLPESFNRKQWQALNRIICLAAEPRLEECVIDSAEALAAQIDALRGHDISAYSKRIKKKKKSIWRRAWHMACAAMFGSILAGGGVWWVLNTASRDSVSSVAQPPDSPHIPASDESIGYVTVVADEPGVSVYDMQGNYIDEAPIGPLPFKNGTFVQYRLKKQSCMDHVVQGIVQTGENTVLQGSLVPFAPPQKGKNWYDTQGRLFVYDPLHDCHVSEPLELPNQEQLPAFLIAANKTAYQQGLLGADYVIFAKRNSPDSKQGILYVTQTYATPIKITTDPVGGTVYWNHRKLGDTPLSEPVPPGAYEIQIYKRGYKPIILMGIDPTGVDISCTLQKVNAVTFEHKWTNSLGTQMIPVPGYPNLLVMEHEVREKDLLALQDYDPTWTHVQNTDYPAVHISCDHAKRFACALTRKERELGLIGLDEEYRLPTDAEWSRFVGITNESGKTPGDNMMNPARYNHQFYWGEYWPPHDKTGNFADTAAVADLPSSRVIVGYADGFAERSPVKSFAPNTLGLYDLDGNVMEWVTDTLQPVGALKEYAVARGADYLSFRPKQLLKSARTPVRSGTGSPVIGFRLVLSKCVSQSPGRDCD